MIIIITFAVIKHFYYDSHHAEQQIEKISDEAIEKLFISFRAVVYPNERDQLKPIFERIHPDRFRGSQYQAKIKIGPYDYTLTSYNELLVRVD